MSLKNRQDQQQLRLGQKEIPFQLAILIQTKTSQSVDISQHD
jgi:hypothetical protein